MIKGNTTAATEPEAIAQQIHDSEAQLSLNTRARELIDAYLHDPYLTKGY